jgi:hypothetical protein
MMKILALAGLLSAVVPASVQAASPGQPVDGTSSRVAHGLVGAPVGLNGSGVPGQVNNNPVGNSPPGAYTGPANENTRTTAIPAPRYLRLIATITDLRFCSYSETRPVQSGDRRGKPLSTR